MKPQNITNCFRDLPPQARSLIVEAFNAQVTPILADYAKSIGLQPADLAIQLSSDKTVQAQTKSLAKSEFLYAQAIEDATTSVHKIENLFGELIYKSYLTDEPLNKSLVNAAMALGLAGMFAGAPHVNSGTHTTPHVQTQQSHQFQAQPWGTSTQDSFLHNLMQLETSGGKNTKHKPTTKGATPGETAIGRWGLMPSTIKEMYNRYKGSWHHPALNKLGKLNNSQMAQYLKFNPDIELHVARALANHVLSAHGGNRLKAAYSWKYGHNLSPDRIGQTQLNDPYVKDFHNLESGKSIRGLEPASFQDKVNPNTTDSTHTGLREGPMLKAEQWFKNKLEKWLEQRAGQKQEIVSNLMNSREDYTSPRPPESPNQPDIKKDLNLDNPTDRIKLAIRKVGESK